MREGPVTAVARVAVGASSRAGMGGTRVDPSPRTDGPGLLRGAEEGDTFGAVDPRVSSERAWIK